MVLELLTKVSEGGEFEAWVGERKAVLGDLDFLGQVFHDVNAGDEEERQDVKTIGALVATLLGKVQNLLVKGLVCAFELSVEKLGVG